MVAVEYIHMDTGRKRRLGAVSRHSISLQTCRNSFAAYSRFSTPSDKLAPILNIEQHHVD